MKTQAVAWMLVVALLVGAGPHLAAQPIAKDPGGQAESAGKAAVEELAPARSSTRSPVASSPASHTAAPDEVGDPVPEAPTNKAPGPETQSPQVSSPPPYPVIGLQPKSMVRQGSWDPWEHAEVNDGRFRHTGFLLRLNLGIGAGWLQAERDPNTGGTVTFSGLGLAGSIALGGAVAPNLVLHGDLFFISILDAAVDGGIYDRDPEFNYDGDVSILAPGLGLTYYLMPANFYLSGALGLANGVWERSDGERQSSRIGIAANLVLGKEWWVDPLWGLGLASQLTFMRAGDYHYRSIRALAVSLQFSATYN